MRVRAPATSGCEHEGWGNPLLLAGSSVDSPSWFANHTITLGNTENFMSYVGEQQFW